MRVIPAAWGYNPQKSPQPDLKGKIRLRPSLIQVIEKDKADLIEFLIAWAYIAIYILNYLDLTENPNKLKHVDDDKNVKS